MRKFGSCQSFDRQSFDHSGHSLFAGRVRWRSDGRRVADQGQGRRAAGAVDVVPAYSAREESPSPTALPRIRRVLLPSLAGRRGLQLAEVALRWGRAASARRRAAASGALWCLAALAAARTL